MEADWSVALAAEDPVIAVPWASADSDGGECGFIDLRVDLDSIDEIAEVRERPALGSALALLHGAGSPLWTAKCGAWTSSVERGDDPFDAYEMDTEPGETGFGAGSYIDLLAHDSHLRQEFEVQERWLRTVTDRLRSVPAPAARVELVMRPAQVHGVPCFGVTWFVEACGATADRAGQRWSDALERALAVLLETRLG